MADYTSKDEAWDEADKYFDEYFGRNTDLSGHNNARDAFRHAYVSGVFSMERGELIAKTLGAVDNSSHG